MACNQVAFRKLPDSKGFAVWQGDCI
ncbi:hypothetical protein SBA4_1620006 [Candidatus Sulfopaludibacter sp. SbA4]|nr:hypothetical protein SBA4_1620006 [Candidatus Sulfopaludibacter sp. SbA4]